MRVCIYEDEEYGNFLPLVYMRPVFELRCGRYTLFGRIRRIYREAEITLLMRDYLKQTVIDHYNGISANMKDGFTLFISGRALLHERIEPQGEEIYVNKEGDIVAFSTSSERIETVPVKREEILKLGLTERKSETRTVKYLWHLINENAREIEADFETGISGDLDRSLVVYGNPSWLSTGKNSRIEAGVVIDVTSGPVLLENDAIIRGPGRIDGPCSVGSGTLIDGALIRPGCSFGPLCRIGGEVEASIFQGYSNKHHEGYLGHSYVCEWVNLGALTTNSDLKNNYSPVKVEIGDEEVDTRSLKVGCFIGDHSKTSIGTLIATGAVIGVFANLLEPGGLSKKVVSSFSWGAQGRYDLEKAIETARKVMSRRNVHLSDQYEQLIRTVHKATTPKEP